MADMKTHSVRAQEVLAFFATSALDMAELVLAMATTKVKEREQRAIEARKRAQQAQPRQTNGSGAHKAAPKKKTAPKKRKAAPRSAAHPASYAGPDRRGGEIIAPGLDQ